MSLGRTLNVSPVTFAELIRRCDSPGKALEALPGIAARSARGKGVDIPPRAAIEKELDAVRRYGARIVASCEPEFPHLLHSLDPPPPVLTLLGNAALGEAVTFPGAMAARAVWMAPAVVRARFPRSYHGRGYKIAGWTGKGFLSTPLDGEVAPPARNRAVGDSRRRCTPC